MRLQNLDPGLVGDSKLKEYWPFVRVYIQVLSVVVMAAGTKQWKTQNSEQNEGSFGVHLCSENLWSTIFNVSYYQKSTKVVLPLRIETCTKN